MNRNSFIGIDLGTTFSAIAHINEYGMPEIIESEEGERITPSVILFDENEVIVGSHAKQNAIAYPGQVVEFVKRFIGDSLYYFEYKGDRYNASELSAYILKKLKLDAEKRLGIEIKEAVIAVPAYFGDPQRRATIEAGEIAGLKVYQLINEPTAAAYSYGLHKIGKDQIVLVFDLGGGTFDVTVMEIIGNKIEIKATNGDHQLGGKDWDDAIIQYIADKFRSIHYIDPLSDEIGYQKLKEKAISAKISLSQIPKVNIFYGFKGKTIKEQLTRKTFEELTSKLVYRCQMLTEIVLKESSLDKKYIDKILLTGGSTRMPMISVMLRNLFDKEPSTELNPYECVAKGAAIKAALLQKETWQLPSAEEKKTWTLLSATEDVNVTSHSFGMVVLKEKELFNSVIIPKNTPYPCKQSRDDYVSTYDNQVTLDLYLIEGEDEDPRNCALLRNYEVYDIDKKPAGKTKLKITYKYNQNQIIEVEAFDLTNNKPLPTKIKEEEMNLDELVATKFMDVALLIDCSGSMEGNKIEDAKRAAIGFVNNFQSSQGKIGLITFPGDVVHYLDSNFSSIKSKIKDFQAYWDGTPMTEALIEAHKQMLTYEGFEKVIVLVTDGVPNDPNSAEHEAAEAKRKGMRIITIGVGCDVNKEFLKRIASSSADYHLVDESFELESTFINIATELSRRDSYLKNI